MEEKAIFIGEGLICTSKIDSERSVEYLTSFSLNEERRSCQTRLDRFRVVFKTKVLN